LSDIQENGFVIGNCRLKDQEGEETKKEEIREDQLGRKTVTETITILRVDSFWRVDDEKTQIEAKRNT